MYWNTGKYRTAERPYGVTDDDEQKEPTCDLDLFEWENILILEYNRALGETKRKIVSY